MAWGSIQLFIPWRLPVIPRCHHTQEPDSLDAETRERATRRESVEENPGLFTSRRMSPGAGVRNPTVCFRQKERLWNEVQSLGEGELLGIRDRNRNIGTLTTFSVSWMLWHLETRWLERDSTSTIPPGPANSLREPKTCLKVHLFCANSPIQSSHPRPPPPPGSFTPGGNSHLPYSR